ncbi:MAG: phosphoribosylglycinamide formyltransferase [Atribacterota bacterium]|nr:phosphoribosylglycinamide formyltransferase [Candidatus Atribacteria bacterium]
MDEKSFVVLVSGRGSNLQALIEATKLGFISGSLSLVISDTPGAYALKRAEKESIPTCLLDYQTFSGKKEYETSLLSVLEQVNPSLICLAGYMRMVGRTIVSRFRYRILNIHPSLLPSFPGLEAQRQAVEYGVKVSGCTVHLVDEGMDTGPIIGQAAVPVHDSDTVESLSERILEQEHRVYPEAVRLFLGNKLEIMGRMVKIKE